ncbi:MAG TPA: hypothetical protein PLI43_06230 [Albidovulum sp.]|nr:hypothetical protein [Albidovulum sp.]
MREVVSIATVFLLLAAAGMQAETPKVAKTCKAGEVAAFFSLGC